MKTQSEFQSAMEELKDFYRNHLGIEFNEDAFKVQLAELIGNKFNILLSKRFEQWSIPDVYNLIRYLDQHSSEGKKKNIFQPPKELKPDHH